MTRIHISASPAKLYRTAKNKFRNIRATVYDRTAEPESMENAGRE